MLEGCDIAGKDFTGDALLTQRALATYLIERESIKKKTCEHTRENALGVTRRTPQQASPQRVLAVNRGHWSIESVHYIFDYLRMTKNSVTVPIRPCEQIYRGHPGPVTDNIPASFELGAIAGRILPYQHFAAMKLY